VTKISFITCVNNNKTYQKCLQYIKRLKIPEDVCVDFIMIRNAPSLAKGYNRGLTISDAHYKVYLHQDVFIINRYFIEDILRIFKGNTSIGLIGLIGAVTIPNSGLWWESPQKAGKVIESHTGKLQLLDFQNTTQDLTFVSAIDGLLMATQYDIPFREDLFDGWHFYDLSEGCEFLKQDYKIAIPKQKKAWCIHDCGAINMNGHDKYRQLFLKEYFDFVNYE
jgi:hypothetical protein